MKTTQSLIQKGKGFSFLMMFLFVFAKILAVAQTAPTVYAIVTLQKVAPENRTEFEKVMKENWKPLHQLRKQNGKITNWVLYKVHFSGATDEYNYVSIMYFDSFVKSEPNDNYPELMKAANPKADAAAIIAKTQSLRTIARQAVYNHIDGTSPKAGAPPIKYILINFMKPKPGMANEYLKSEKEDWKPIHQSMADEGQRLGWNLWSYILPAGTASNHDYVTSDSYSSYDQIAGAGFEAAFKKVHPGKDLQAIIDRTTKLRDLVKSELWEFVVGL